jgi:hypothetical protein
MSTNSSSGCARVKDGTVWYCCRRNVVLPRGSRSRSAFQLEHDHDADLSIESVADHHSDARWHLPHEIYVANLLLHLDVIQHEMLSCAISESSCLVAAQEMVTSA